MESLGDNLIQRIINDMDEGVMLINGQGIVRTMNPAVAEILDKPMEEILGNSLVDVFLDDDENDQFFQTVMDAIYEPDLKHDSLIPYFSGAGRRILHMSTSVLRGDETIKGLIVTFSDLTEITELKIKHAEEIMEMMNSMVRAFVTAVEARSAYNVHHTKNMIAMARAFIAWLKRTDNPLQFDKEKADVFLMSIALHDIGKLSVPLSVMDKPTRLAWRMDNIRERFTKIDLIEKVRMLEGKITEGEYEEGRCFRKEALGFIDEMNTCGFCSPEKAEQVRKLAETTYINEEGEPCSLLTDEETEMLLVVKGTLTDKEREVMQNHVVVTSDILSQIKFPKNYEMVPIWAGEHHEYLNGTGYPNGLVGEQICIEVRLITILDIYEAITSRDRPYKKPVTPEGAFAILDRMANEGSIDSNLLVLFKNSKAWEVV